MKYGGKTDVGVKRKCNQDSFAVFSKDGYFCAIVCDGMGGVKGGNVASGLAVKTFASYVKKAFSDRNADDFVETDIKRLLKFALDAANDAVYDKSGTDPELEGMGTTLVATVVYTDSTTAFFSRFLPTIPLFNIFWTRARLPQRKRKIIRTKTLS